MDPIMLMMEIAELFDQARELDAQNQRELMEKEMVNNIRDISSKINLILAHFEQDILRTIFSAYDAIITAKSTENLQTRAIRLNYAENQLLYSTQLNRSMSTANTPNTSWVALSHYGLVIVCILREDPDEAFIHLLKMFEAEPRLARSELAPVTYELLFANIVDQILEESCKGQENEIEKNECFWEYAGEKSFAGLAAGLQVIMGVSAGLAAEALGARGIARPFMEEREREAERIWNQPNRNDIIQRKKEESRANFIENKEILEDYCCRELAQYYLNEGLSLKMIQGTLAEQPP